MSGNITYKGWTEESYSKRRYCFEAVEGSRNCSRIGTSILSSILLRIEGRHDSKLTSHTYQSATLGVYFKEAIEVIHLRYRRGCIRLLRLQEN